MPKKRWFKNVAILVIRKAVFSQKKCDIKGNQVLFNQAVSGSDILIRFYLLILPASRFKDSISASA